MRARPAAALFAAASLLAAGLIPSAAGASTLRPLSTSTKYSLVTEPADNYQRIYSVITSAKSTLDMTMYELVDTTAEHDLAADAARGVTVRVILDQNLEKSNNTTAFN